MKTKEFKEVKELLIANDIVKSDSQIVAGAGTLAEICDALTDQQASKLINVLIAAKTPERGRAYSTARINKATTTLNNIKATIDDWGFDGLL